MRIDAGVREGDAVLPFYDPMIAKLIVHGADRAEALARLDRALAETHIVGPHTNVAFLRRVVRSRSFAGADLDTALIEREHAALFDAAPLPFEIAAAGVIAHTLRTGRQGETSDPWSRTDGWRLGGRAVRRFTLEVDGEQHAVTLERSAAGNWLVLGAQRRSVDFGTDAAAEGHSHDITLDGHHRHLTVYATPGPTGQRSASSRRPARRWSTCPIRWPVPSMRPLPPAAWSRRCLAS